MSRSALVGPLSGNTVKISVPWQLGHPVAVSAAFGSFEGRDRLTLSATAAT